MNAKLKYSTVKLLFENLYFHDKLDRKFLNDKDLFQKQIDDMIHDNRISRNILDKVFLDSYDKAIKDMQQFAKIKFN